MLKITRAADPITVERLNMVIYGPPGLGKTSLAFTADKPLLLDFDGGSHRAVGRKDVVRVGSWADVSSISAEDLAPFNTVIMDTAGRALDSITADIIKTDPKGHKNGALTLPGYGVLKSRFATFLKLLNSFGKDVVLIAHMDEQRNGDDLIERLDVQGSSKGEIYKAADVMGRLSMLNGKLMLRFSPSDAAFGKNPGQLPPFEVPHNDKPEFQTYLADIFRLTKDKLNTLSADQQEAAAEQAWFRDTLPKVGDAAGLNGLLGRAKDAGQACKIMVRDRAKALGLVFDDKAKVYVVAQKEAA